MRVKPQPTAPSLPAKQVPKNANSGPNNNSVGPTQYKPQVAAIKKRHPATNFAISKSKRKVFE